MFVLFAVTTTIFALTACFLGFELFKKFRLAQTFGNTTNQLIVWPYRRRAGDMVGMRNIVLRGKRPFCVLVGFTPNIPGWGECGHDYYAFVRSDERGVAVIRTYLGKRECDFQFLLNVDQNTNPVVVSSNEEDQQLWPQCVCPPHWYQRLGL